MAVIDPTDPPPGQPPTSLIVSQFTGIKNTVAPERLVPGELAAAVNVDIDDAGQLRRRRGYRRIDSAAYHSLTENRARCFVVKDGVLGRLRADYVHLPIVAVGPEPLAYTAVGDTLYYASRVASGKITGDLVPHPWGSQVNPGQWISPVMTPTDTLGAISGKLLGAPPMATELEHYKGRIYLAAGKLLWATELYLYDRVDKTRGFIQFEDDITMVRAVDDGLYVGTTAQLIFLGGTFDAGLKRTDVLDVTVVPGSAVSVPTDLIHPLHARMRPIPESNSPVFLTSNGVLAGFSGGEVYNLTQGQVVFPGVARAAALYREDSGVSSFVVVADSAGGPSANARIGDYVSAEIVRASQGG